MERNRQMKKQKQDEGKRRPVVKVRKTVREQGNLDVKGGKGKALEGKGRDKGTCGEKNKTMEEECMEVRMEDITDGGGGRN